MKMIKLKLFTTLLLFLFSVYSFSKRLPNIVFIMADDLGGRDLPTYGNKFNEAPHIDKLAIQGMIFENAYAAPVSSPTRASIQSGQYPARVGVFDFISGHWRPYEEVIVPHNETQYLPNNIFTIGDVMKTEGYKTGYFGKWHLGYKSEHLPDKRGYEKSYVYKSGGYYNPKFIPEYISSKKNSRLSNILTEMGVDFIKKNKDEPFFLFIAHYDVHVQLDADQSLINKFLNKKKLSDYPCNAVYAAMIEHVDNSVGSIMDTLDEVGLTDNTILIFYSDNGGVDNRYDNIPLLEGNSLNVYPENHPLQYIATSNAPFRGGKGTLYEGGIRVPLIVRWPGVITPASKSEAIVSCVDFYPTLLDITKAKKPTEQVLDGFSLVPIWKKNIFNNVREVFTHYPVYHHEQPMSAVRKGDWKLVENLVTGECNLYNLKYDINEMTDLRFSYPTKLEEMKQVLKKWQENTNAKMPIPNPNFDPLKRYEWGKNPYWN